MRIKDLFNFKNKREFEHLVRINFQYGYQSLEELHALESKLELLLYNDRIGELDGYEIKADYSGGILYLYGYNAEELFKLIQPTLLSTSFMKQAEVHLRFGDLNDESATEIDFVLD